MSAEAAIGRWTAYVVHPQAAWRRLRPRGRALLVGTYVGAGYVGALIALIAIT
jgi:type II secretory pathway component PulM